MPDRPVMMSEFRRFGVRLGALNYVVKALLADAVLFAPDRREFVERFDAEIERSFGEGIEVSAYLDTTVEVVREEMKAVVRSLLSDAVAAVEAWEQGQKRS